MLTIRGNISKTVLNISKLINETITTCGYPDIVQIIRGNKEKSNPLDFSKIQLPRVLIEESGEFTMSRVDTTPTTIGFENGTYFMGINTKVKSSFIVRVFSKDLEVSRFISLTIARLFTLQKIFLLDKDIMEGDVIVGIHSKSETVYIVGEDIEFTHNPLDVTIVYELQANIPFTVESGNYTEVTAPNTAKEIKFEVASLPNDTVPNDTNDGIEFKQAINIEKSKEEDCNDN